MLNDIKTKIENDDDSQISDLHLWNVAPGRIAAIVSVITHEKRQADEYKLRLSGLGLSHVTIELNHCSR